MILKSLKRIINVLFIIVISCLIGQTLLILVYCLPTDEIALNIGRGAQALLTQGSGYNYAEDYRESILDNETDAVMLSEACFPSASPKSGGVLAPRLVFAGRESQVYSLMAYLNQDDLSNAAIVEYPRYWHGYLVILKPFFSLFDYSDFKIMNQAIQLLMIIQIICLMIKRNLKKYLIAFIPMLIIWNPATIGVSLQYAACFYVSMISSIIILERNRIRRYWILFLICGILTSYLDFLTYPIVTYGIPMIFVILRMKEDSEESTKKPLVIAICNGIYWSVGYLGMWFSKWVIGSILTDRNVLQDALFNIESRTSNIVEGEQITRLGTVARLLRVTFFKWPYMIMFGIVMLVILMTCKKVKFKVNIHYIVTLLFIGILPIVWFMVTANHSYIHPRLVYRDWGITILSLISIVPLCSTYKPFGEKTKLI